MSVSNNFLLAVFTLSIVAALLPLGSGDGCAVGADALGDSSTVAKSTADASIAALKGLYESTSGTRWARGWGMTSSGYCEWYGVECRGNEVVAVRLPRNNLQVTAAGPPHRITG